MSGRKRSPTRSSWHAMLQRCRNPNRNMLYSARGIKVCERWTVYANFLADMGERPPGTTLDRIDNNGNYEPGNCRWASAVVQANNKSTNRSIEWEGRRQSLTQWAREFRVKPEKLAEIIGRMELNEAMLYAMFCAPGVSTPPRMISHQGKSQSLKAWAREIGIASKSLRERLNMWTVEKALTEPPRRVLTVQNVKRGDGVMRTIVIAVLCLGLAGPAWANTLPPLIKMPPGYVKSMDNPPPVSAPGRGDMPAAEDMKVTAPRLPGDKDDCVPTGDRNGPNGCTVLKSDRNHYEWPTLGEAQ